MRVLFYPLITEKAIKQVEIENKISFVVDSRATKAQIAEEIKTMFKVNVDKINVHIRNNKKIATIKLKASSPAIDIATKLGMM